MVDWIRCSYMRFFEELFVVEVFIYSLGKRKNIRKGVGEGDFGERMKLEELGLFFSCYFFLKNYLRLSF